MIAGLIEDGAIELGDSMCVFLLDNWASGGFCEGGDSMEGTEMLQCQHRQQYVVGK